MPRQPKSGAGAADRAPSGAAARAPAPSSASLPTSPQRYRALRARYNALLVTLYERSTLTVREIAFIAGRTNRAVQMLVREIGCRPRNARNCRPGTDVGVRREGPKLAPLNAPATRRVAAAFADVARALAASTETRAADELQRATVRAQWRTARTQARVMTSTARQLTYLASAMEHARATQDALARQARREAKHRAARKPAPRAAKPPRFELWQLEARISEAHIAADRAKAAAVAAAAAEPPLDPEFERRINATAARYEAEARRAQQERQDAEARRGPRIRQL